MFGYEECAICWALESVRRAIKADAGELTDAGNLDENSECSWCVSLDWLVGWLAGCKVTGCVLRGANICRLSPTRRVCGRADGNKTANNWFHLRNTCARRHNNSVEQTNGYRHPSVRCVTTITRLDTIYANNYSWGGGGGVREYEKQ